MHRPDLSKQGFTLIELSIVLVIIGLVVGGVLVGQDLVRAASERAQVSQIEKYNTAANTFRDKYGYLPGDIKNPDATNFGFVSRGPSAGDGDGNGVIEWDHATANTYAYGSGVAVGEEGMFWVDLSTAHLIDGGFNSSVPVGNINGGATVTGAAVNNYIPLAKIGGGNSVFVWSGGLAVSGWNLQTGNGVNYFGIEVIPLLRQTGTLNNNGAAGLTVRQAYDIDVKMDDGLPQYGNVLAQYVPGAGGGSWVANTTSFPWAGPPSTSAFAGSSTTCYDNSTAATGTPGVAGNNQHYSLEISGGSNVSCALSFKFQ